jgi:hypothetical protein
VNETKLAGGQSQLRELAFFCHQLCFRSGGADQLAAFAGFHFHIVNIRTDRDIAQRQCVSDNDVRIGAAFHGLSDLQALRCQDIAFFTVYIVQKCDIGRAVRIVFNGGYFCRHIVFVSFEVDYAVFAFCPAATVTRGDYTSCVSAAGSFQVYCQRLLGCAFGHFRKIGDAHVAQTRRGRFKFSDSHISFSPS